MPQHHHVLHPDDGLADAPARELHSRCEDQRHSAAGGMRDIERRGRLEMAPGDRQGVEDQRADVGRFVAANLKLGRRLADVLDAIGRIGPKAGGDILAKPVERGRFRRIAAQHAMTPQDPKVAR